MTDLNVFSAKRIFDGDRFHDDSALLVAGDKVVGVVPLSEVPAQTSKGLVEADLLCPGFVDWQVNGGGGVLLNEDPTAKAMADIARSHLAFGTTALLPTVITDTPRVTERAARAAVEAMNCGTAGVVGIHFEGPHLSHEKCGVHDPSFIRPMEAEDVARYTRLGLGKTVVTVAPENVTFKDIAALAAAGVVVSLGHTNADYQTAAAAFSAGASAVTHLFNAMAPLHHREPGLIGAAMDTPHVWCGLIADGHHVHASVLRTVFEAGPQDRLTLVTDAMSTVGVETDEFMLNGRTVLRENGCLTISDGTLAGSDLDMMSAVRFCVTGCRQPLGRVLQMASRNPARMLGLEKHGHFQKGARADILALTESLELSGVWLGGRQTAS